jgi:hypothetical protein
MENSRTEVEQAKAILEQHGYYVDNLWSKFDVTDRYECTDDQAQRVLGLALKNDYTMEQTWLAIDDACDILKIKLIKEDNED